MRKKVKRKTILIDGIRYYDDKPDTCRKCFFWKNRKVGCVLGTQNCYYLAEAVKTEQERNKYTADYDKKLTFDIEKYLSTRAKLYPKDEFFVMEEEN